MIDKIIINEIFYILFFHNKSSESCVYLAMKSHLHLDAKFSVAEVNCHFVQVKFCLTEKYFTVFRKF